MNIKRLLGLAIWLANFALVSAQKTQVEQLGEASVVNIATPIDILGNVPANTVSPNETPFGRPIQNVKLSLVNSEIVIDYELAEMANNQTFYQVDFDFRLDGQSLTINEFDEFRGDFGIVDAAGVKKLILINPLEKFSNIKGNLTVRITCSRYGVIPQLVNCDDPRPTFNGRQQLPYLVAGVVGAGSLAYGYILKGNGDDKYERYLNREPGTLEEANALYDDAQSDVETAQIFAIAGLGVLALDATMYIIRTINVNKKQKQYDKVCNDGLTFSPSFQAPTLVNPKGQVGMNVKLTF